jgi:glutamine amidotransferase
LNLALTNGECVVVSRCASKVPAPSLYYTIDSPFFPRAVVIASERLFASSDWVVVPEDGIVAFDADLTVSRTNLRQEAA